MSILSSNSISFNQILIRLPFLGRFRERLYFRTDGYLYDETRNLLTQEFADISIVNNIVEQIASGENTLNTIAAKIGEKEPTVLYSLDKLINVGLVEKKKCITDENDNIRTQSADIDVVAISE